MVDGLKEMMDKGISFSLYMTHGGTTFGWWGGANNPAYSAMCSSYDYDAPISEAGWTTDKYFALRNMLKDYMDEGQTLPEVPEALPCNGSSGYQIHSNGSADQQPSRTEADRGDPADGEI